MTDYLSHKGEEEEETGGETTATMMVTVMTNISLSENSHR